MHPCHCEFHSHTFTNDLYHASEELTANHVAYANLRRKIKIKKWFYQTIICNLIYANVRNTMSVSRASFHGHIMHVHTVAIHSYALRSGPHASHSTEQKQMILKLARIFFFVFFFHYSSFIAFIHSIFCKICLHIDMLFLLCPSLHDDCHSNACCCYMPHHY